MSDQWCRTERMAAAFDCTAMGHDVATFNTGGIVTGPVAVPSSGCVIEPKDQDPATEQWREAMSRSTGSRLREALEANQELAMEHAKCVLEIHRLRRQLAVRGGDYYLTDKGRAAIARPTDTENQEPHP